MYLVKIQVYRRDNYCSYTSELDVYTDKKVEDIPKYMKEAAKKHYPEDYVQFDVRINSLKTIDGEII